jgi:autotransporter passenger strand-loop-strand repeat protein
LVESGGRINVSGGVASATILSSGGTATIGKGGTAIGSLVAGGSQIVGSGGIATQPGSVPPVSIMARKPVRPAAVRSAPW